MGWTGGQYSLWRTALAIAVVTGLRPGMSADNTGLLILVVVLALALAIGWYDRVVACALACVVLAIDALGHEPAFPAWIGDVVSGRAAVWYAGVLILHASVPRAPFGSLEARGRVDPRGGWQRPQWQISTFWWLLAIVALGRLLTILGANSLEAPSLGHPLSVSPNPDVAPLFLLLASRVAHVAELLAALVGLTSKRARPRMWVALVLWRIAWLFAFGADAHDAISLVILLGASDPGWWTGRSLRAGLSSTSKGDAPTPATVLPARLFYDGDCGFCHRSVRFILSEELATPAPLCLRFAPLGSTTFGERMAHHPGLDPASLPDSIVLELEDGTILTRSAAALEIASRLGGFWRLLALIGSRLPSRLLDAGYDGIARVRKRLFAAPKDACPILPPDLRARFDP